MPSVDNNMRINRPIKLKFQFCRKSCVWATTISKVVTSYTRSVTYLMPCGKYDRKRSDSYPSVSRCCVGSSLRNASSSPILKAAVIYLSCQKKLKQLLVTARGFEDKPGKISLPGNFSPVPEAFVPLNNMAAAHQLRIDKKKRQKRTMGWVNLVSRKRVELLPVSSALSWMR